MTNEVKQEICAYIPARGGSKGIPRKNIADLGGKPLIAYTIESALACPWINRVVVNTDSKTIAKTAERFGAEVPFLRPPELGTDHISSTPGLQYMHTRLYPDPEHQPIRVVFYPTSPFRPPWLLEKLIKEALKGPRKVEVVKPIDLFAHSIVLPDKEGRLHRPLGESAMFDKSRSRLFFRPYGLGSVYNPLASRETISTISVRDKVCLVDIDLPEDLRLAQHLINEGLVPWLEN